MPDIPIPEYACLRAISSASFFRRPGRRAVATTRRHLLWSAPQHVTLHKYRHLGNREFHYTLPRPLRACSACEHAWQHCSTLSSKDLKDIIRKPILPRANLICRAGEYWPSGRARVVSAKAWDHICEPSRIPSDSFHGICYRLCLNLDLPSGAATGKLTRGMQATHRAA